MHDNPGRGKLLWKFIVIMMHMPSACYQLFSYIYAWTTDFYLNIHLNLTSEADVSADFAANFCTTKSSRFGIKISRKLHNFAGIEAQA